MQLRTLLVGTSVAAFGLALSQQPTPRLWEATTKAVNASSEIDQLTAERPTAATSTSVDLVKGEGAEQPNAQSSQYNWDAIGVLAAIILGGFQIRILINQNGIAEKQRLISKTQNEIIATQTTHMAQGLIVAQANADASKLSAVAAITSVEQMDRPWLDVKVRVLQQPRLTKGKPLAIHFHLIVTNVGRSAAQHVMLAVGIVANESDIDPMDEVTRVINSLPSTNVRGQVILPGGELVKEFILHTTPLTSEGVTPTIFGGVRYTHGRAADGSGVPSPKYHTTTFGLRVKAKNNIGSSTLNEDGSRTWFWDPEVETSARDFHHAD